jgi:hypothetical protein
MMGALSLVVFVVSVDAGVFLYCSAISLRAIAETLGSEELASRGSIHGWRACARFNGVLCGSSTLAIAPALWPLSIGIFAVSNNEVKDWTVTLNPRGAKKASLVALR